MDTKAPLHGLHVLDLSWVMAGPAATRYLSDLGAYVVKIESSARVDPLRTLPPFKAGQPGTERSVSYHNHNAGKRSLTVDLKHPQGRELVLKLARWADVAVESFTVRALRDMRLTYEDLEAENPRLVMVSTSLVGMTGPHAASTTGVGTIGSALGGATFLVGWPDRPPAGPFGPWTDSVSPRFMVAAILAALHRRKRTGEGCHIDLAQAEAGLQFLSPAALDYAVNGIVPTRRGSWSDLRVPQGSYPCAGDDRWVAIDASAAADWNALRAATGDALVDPRFDTLIGRLRHRQLVDTALAAWTADQDADAVEARLQAAGVPAHVVSRSGDISRDPQVRTSGYLRPIDDPVIGDAEVEGPRFSLDRTPHVPVRRGPLIGEHTAEILRDACGLDDQEIADLAAAGVLA